MRRKQIQIVISLLIVITQACSNLPASPTNTTSPATLTPTSTLTPPPTVTVTPSPTPIPLAWKQISDGQEFARDSVTAIVVDPKDHDVIYIGMQSAGIFKSIDGGDSWARTQQNLSNAQITSLVFHPQDANTLLAATQGGVFVTDNGGKSWAKRSDLIGKFLLIDPENGSHLYLGDGQNVFESNNMGSSWTQTHAGGNCPSAGRDYNTLIMDPINSDTLFATMTVMDECRGVYRSTNNGRSWTRLGLMRAGAFAVVQDKDGNSSYLAAGNDTTDSNVLFISTNQGKDWSNQQSYNCSILTTQPQDPSSAYCGVEEGGLFVISPRGGILQSGIASEHVTAIHVDNYNGQKRILAGVEKTGLFISLDGGKTWFQKTGGIGASNLTLKTSSTNVNQMFASANFNNSACVLYRSDSHGESWKIILDAPKDANDFMSSCSPSIDANNAIYTIRRLALAQSLDGGDSWSFIPIPTVHNLSERWVYVNPSMQGSIYFLANDKPALYYSNDLGQSWQPINSSQEYWRDQYLFFSSDEQVFYHFDSNGQGERSSNFGKTWSRCGDVFPANINSDSFLVINPNKNSSLIYATAGAGIKTSTNNCQSWKSSNNGLNNLFVNTLAIDPNNPNTVYAGTDNSAYVSFDFGKTWSEINDGLTDTTVIYSIAVDKDGNVYAATPNGIFQLERK